jgi:rod shape-determining protein MreC
LLLVLLIAIAFALITVDIRGGENSPLDSVRRAAASAFGPVENGVASAVDPIGNAIGAVRDSDARHNRIADLERENAALKARLGSDDRTRGRAAELDKMLKTAGAGRYGIKGAEVIAIGAAQGFSWTITIDAGANDGLKRDMTVLNGDGLVGRVVRATSSTATVLLLGDRNSTVGGRLDATMALGFVSGRGEIGSQATLEYRQVDLKARPKVGAKVVTWGSRGNAPYVAGVPIGVISSVGSVQGTFGSTAVVKPYVDAGRLDTVGVVVGPTVRGPRQPLPGQR